eukprot:CAMPEP_0194318286 /NCGR_PEP_ID=MMETSP0171-20130528/14907_1 /TAXON_ID=218684 /ORGANISM="Corethron pennatum, Strain L29A3" /LENGTH=1087 /DNA_ID=CAMNT_0039075149 /DNA_START=655 /DNA_END=3915 /DNA_ORIENTATION=+
MTEADLKKLVRNIPEFDETLKEKGRFATTLLSDLLRLFEHFNIVLLSRSSSRISLKTENCLDLLNQVHRSGAKFFLRKWILPEEESSDTSIYPCTISTLTNSVASTSFSSQEKGNNSEELLYKNREILNKNRDLVTDSAIDNSNPHASQERRNAPAMDENKEFQSLGNNLTSDFPTISTLPNQKGNDGAQISNVFDLPESFKTWSHFLSFLSLFELTRLYQSKKIGLDLLNGDIKEYCMNNNSVSVYEMCCSFHRIANTPIMNFKRVLENACQNNLLVDHGLDCVPVLTFSGSLIRYQNKKPQIILSVPREAEDRRIYRKFGSHRFLAVKIPIDTPEVQVEKLACEDLHVAGRKWEFLWARKNENPQVFVFFAVSGAGINTSEEISIETITDWCIPKQFNPGLTVGKRDKRIKLSFSQTTPGGKLPRGSLRKINDIISNDGEIMTDGCGLISLEALNFIWKTFSSYKYKHDKLLNPSVPSNKINSDAEDEIVEEEECPCSQFQGRIGGLKGMWVLDPSLDGFQVLFRDSQVKYHLPMESMENLSCTITMNNSAFYDELYDTVDIKEFDDSPIRNKKAFLNKRAIQILEHRRVPDEYLMERVEKGIHDPISTYSGDYISDLIRDLNKKDARKTNPVLWKMCAIEVDKDEPYFAKKRVNALKKELETIEKKARYPVPHCYYFRMLPDHNRILNEDEVFITKKIKDIEFLVAMRFPIYFGSDLIKRKPISLETLERRCNNQAKFNFYRKLKNCILLSTKGSRSSADMMSGGDFDGDTAWVCFDENLVNHISPSSPTEKIPSLEKHSRQMEKAKDGKAGCLQMIKYVRNFKRHKNQLSTLSVTLDKVNDEFGVDSDEAKIVARKAFLQVDHPFQLQELSHDEKMRVNRGRPHCGKPHWITTMWQDVKEKKDTYDYNSNKILGKIRDEIEKKRPSLETGEGTRSKVISQYLWNERKKAAMDDKVERNLTVLRGKMKEALIKYNLDLNEKLKEPANTPEEKEELDAWKVETIKVWDKILFPDKKDVADYYLRGSILYDVCLEEAAHKGREMQESYTFGWEVAGSLYCKMYANEDNGNSTSYSHETQDALFKKK